MIILNIGKKLKAELDVFREANQALKAQIEGLQDIEKKANRMISENLRLSQEIKSLKAELISAKNTIRKQTEADLLLNALKAVGIIKEEKEDKPNYFAQDLALQARLGQQQRSSALTPLEGLFGGIM